MQQHEESDGDIVIVGAGLAGLAAALGLHRKGVRSVVLESSPALRASGFAFAVWPNAFRALDALGVGDKIRSLHVQAEGLRVTSSSTGEVARELDFLAPQGKQGGGHFEFRAASGETCCFRFWRQNCQGAPSATPPRSSPSTRNTATAPRLSNLLTAQLSEQRQETCSTSVTTFYFCLKREVSGYFYLSLLDRSALQLRLNATQLQVLIGCDGINSVVSKWLGLAKPSYSGRSAARGLAHYPDGHAFQPKFLQFFGQGFRFGYVPCNANDVYWFYTWSPSPDEDGVDKSGAKMKQYVLTKLRSSMVPTEALELVQRSELNEDAPATPLRFRSPFSLLFAEISKGNVCVAGDALHPMTPDLGQGGCAALEDGVVLARCLGEAILGGGASTGGVAEKERIESGLQKYAGIRRWRSIELVGTAYTVGFFQQSENAFISFLREKVLAGVLAGRLVKMTKVGLVPFLQHGICRG